MGKEKWHKVKFKKSTKNDSIEFREQKKKQKRKKIKKTNKQKIQNGNQILYQQIAKL